MISQFREEIYLYALNKIKDIGPYRITRLLERFGLAKNVFEASESALQKSGVLKPEQIIAITRFSDFLLCHQKITMAQTHGIKIASYQDDQYPYRLREISSYPTQLFYRGNLGIANDVSLLGIVGARRMTAYGKQVIEEFVRELVRKNVVIVSGLAFGVDVTTHMECLKHSGKTIAIQAQGVDQGYPRTNQRYFDEIIESNGCVVSEFGIPEHDLNEKFLFPRRNRLISGMSDGVLVVEAAERSGALITARFAVEQNREVFSIPGKIYQKMSAGCLRLIQQGAKAVLTPDDILEELGIGKKKKKTQTKSIPMDLFESPLEHQIFSLCQETSKTMDDIIDQTEESPSVISATITKMQLLGRIQEVEGRRFESVD